MFIKNLFSYMNKRKSLFSKLDFCRQLTVNVVARSICGNRVSFCHRF